MKNLLIVFYIWSSLVVSAHAQGLIGVAPEGEDPKLYFEKKRKLALRLELERAKLFHEGLKNLRSRTKYCSVVWELGLTYESLCRWQDSLAAYNTMKDLKLPPNAMAHCDDCIRQATDDVIAGDLKRLQSKAAAVESVDHVKFDRNKRLPMPHLWGLKERAEYESVSRKEPLRRGRVMTLNLPHHTHYSGDK